MDSDVLIIGGGPAGLHAGKLLANDNLRVILVNKSFLDKPSQLIHKSGLNDLNLEINYDYVIKEVNKLYLVSPSNISVELSNEDAAIDEKGYIIDSKLFNDYLIEEALNAGCDFRDDTSVIALEKINNAYIVTCKKDNKEYEVKTKIVIIADGYPSNVTNSLGFLTNSNFDKICQCEVSDVYFNKVELHFGSASPNGYIWIYPKNDSKIEVGISINENHLPFTAEEYLLKFINSYFKLDLKDLNIYSGLFPVGSLIERSYDDNLLICGEAAGEVNPFIGGGIISSMKGAKNAAYVVSNAIKNNNCSKRYLRKYRSLVKKDFGNDFDKLLKVRNYAFSLSDDEIDSIASSFEGVSFANMNIYDILNRLIKISPSGFLKLRKLL